MMVLNENETKIIVDALVYMLRSMYTDKEIANACRGNRELLEITTKKKNKLASEIVRLIAIFRQ